MCIIGGYYLPTYKKYHFAKSQFGELNGRLMWCDFGANLVQHFMLAYSRYSRYRTKSHDTQTKRVVKLACQRASAYCSASVLRIAKQSA